MYVRPLVGWLVCLSWFPKMAKIDAPIDALVLTRNEKKACKISETFVLFVNHIWTKNCEALVAECSWFIKLSAVLTLVRKLYGTERLGERVNGMTLDNCRIFAGHPGGDGTRVLAPQEQRFSVYPSFLIFSHSSAHALC